MGCPSTLSEHGRGIFAWGAVTHARSIGGEKLEHRQGTGSGEHNVVVEVVVVAGEVVR